MLMSVIYTNSFTKDTVAPCLSKMKAPAFSAIRSRLHTKPSLIEAQSLSHRMMIVLQMQTHIIFLRCRFFNNQIP